MSKFGPRLGAALLAAAALAGCMTGRASLLATQGGQAGAAQSSLTGPAGANAPIGPSRFLAASGNVASPPGSSRESSAALRVSTGLGPVRDSANLTAPAPSLGAIRASSGVSASAGQIAAAGRTNLAITPSLAPASSVGASVAAVSQPLNVAAAAQAGVHAGSATTVKSTAKIKAVGIGVAVHVGP